MQHELFIQQFASYVSFTLYVKILCYLTALTFVAIQNVCLVKNNLLASIAAVPVRIISLDSNNRRHASSYFISFLWGHDKYVYQGKKSYPCLRFASEIRPGS